MRESHPIEKPIRILLVQHFPYVGSDARERAIMEMLRVLESSPPSLHALDGGQE